MACIRLIKTKDGFLFPGMMSVYKNAVFLFPHPSLRRIRAWQ